MDPHHHQAPTGGGAAFVYSDADDGAMYAPFPYDDADLQMLLAEGALDFGVGVGDGAVGGPGGFVPDFAGFGAGPAGGVAPGPSPADPAFAFASAPVFAAAGDAGGVGAVEVDAVDPASVVLDARLPPAFHEQQPGALPPADGSPAATTPAAGEQEQQQSVSTALVSASPPPSPSSSDVVSSAVVSAMDSAAAAAARRRQNRMERRGHTKSRRGCFNCKRRRIKVSATSGRASGSAPLASCVSWWCASARTVWWCAGGGAASTSAPCSLSTYIPVSLLPVALPQHPFPLVATHAQFWGPRLGVWGASVLLTRHPAL
jgi:hypothetical protein